MNSSNVLVDKKFYNLLLKDTIAPYYELNLIKKQKGKHPNAVYEEEYEEGLDGLIGDHVDYAADYVESTSKNKLDNEESSLILMYAFNKIINNRSPKIKSTIKDTYTRGKQLGESRLDVPPFTGRADKAAVRIAQTYNYNQIQNVSSSLRDGIRGVITQGLIDGSSNYEIAELIRDLSMTPLPAGGRMLTPEQRATMIARTETSRAMTQGTVIAYQEHGIEEVEFVTAGDELVCMDCMELEGEIFPIGNIPEYASIPVHPSCRCTYNPVIGDNPIVSEDIGSFNSLYSDSNVDAESIL